MAKPTVVAVGAPSRRVVRQLAGDPGGAPGAARPGRSEETAGCPRPAHSRRPDLERKDATTGDTAATYPIVLVHGIARFDWIFRRLVRPDGDPAERTHYFRGIRPALRALGFRVHHASTPGARRVRERALALRGQVEQVLRVERAAKVHIIGHSMGGLDARHLLFENAPTGMHSRVASLTTLGTPHLGSAYADWSARRAAPLVALLARGGRTELDGFLDLTTAACLEYDRRAARFERECGVLFQTYAGVQPLARTCAPLKLTWLLLQRLEGPNDGLVSRRSAAWREEYFRGEIDADHVNLLGWWDPDELGWGLRPAGLPAESSTALQRRIQELYVRIALDLARRFPVSRGQESERVPVALSGR